MTEPRRHSGHPIADLSFAEGLVVCGCGWRSVRGLGCDALNDAYRAHRRERGLRLYGTFDGLDRGPRVKA